MAKTLEEVYQEALELPDESKECLAERLTEYLATHIDPAIERSHIETVKRRRDEVLSGEVKPVDAEAALAEARLLLER